MSALSDMKIRPDQLEASVLRDSFSEFVRKFWSVVVPEKLIWNWHMELLCDEMQAGADRVFKGLPKEYDLVINVSPGSSKSTICSVMFVAWTWATMPTARHICGSYSYALALDLSRKTRDLVTSDEYRRLFPHVQLRDDQNTKGNFQTTRGGGRYAVGVNGSVLGMHAHFIQIDDPIDPTQAVSEADLKMANTWLRETLPSRKVDKAVSFTTLIMQRLHQDDPTALFLSRPNVRHVCLPAELTEHVNPPELKAFYKEGLMDPVRLSRKVLDDYKVHGEYMYSAQFLQTPVPPGGGMFKTLRIKRVRKAPRFWKSRVRFWDKAGTQGGDGAYTVGLLMGLDDAGRYYVLDVKRFRKDSFEREIEIESTAKADGKTVRIGLEQEPGSGGKESAESTVRRLAGFSVSVVKADKSTGGKVERADPLSSQVNAGNLYILEAEWNSAFIEEMKFFPFSRYKDQIDAASGAFNLLSQRRIRAGGISNRDSHES